jgi:hypothetical protein
VGKTQAYSLDSFKNVILAKRMIMAALTELYPDEGSGFRNNVIYHILAYVSAKQFYTSSHAAGGWRSKSLDLAELQDDVRAVVRLFEEAGGTDQIAKSPAFQGTVAAAAKAKRDGAAASTTSNLDSGAASNA